MNRRLCYTTWRGRCVVLFIIIVCIVFTNLLNAHSHLSMRRPHRKQEGEHFKQLEVQKEPYDVIILTYMRCGSSYAGEVFGVRDDTFYWSEPLWRVHMWRYHSKGQLICNYGGNGDRCQNISSTSNKSIQHTLEFLSDLYKCNIKKHFNQFISASWRGGEVFKKCMNSFKNCTECEKDNSRSGSVITTAQCGNCPANQTRLCYDKWIGRCNSTTHRATKVIRLDTAHARYLLENHKRLKLIQLFRDPRAVISSRNISGWYYRTRSKVPGYITNDVKVLCRRMENDLASALELKVLFPDRVKIIQYEDFYDPIRTAKIFYNFLNMKMTDYIKNSKPVSQKIDKNLYNRKTKRFHPDSYRDRLDASVILDTNKYCENVYVNLGLRIFKSKIEVKNKSLSVVMGKIPYPLD